MVEIDLVGVIVILLLLVVGYFFIYKTPSSPPRPLPQSVKGAGQGKPAARRKKEVEVPADTKGKVKVFYGSQTGTASDLSHMLSKEARRHGIFAEVVDLEVYDVNELKNEPLVIFLMATHGEGDPTDNAKDFYTWLGSTEADLSRVNFTVFGLGNKTYEHYNAIGRFVDKRMQELGAHCFFEKGEGDDDSSLEEDFNKWKKKLWGPLCRQLGIAASDSTEEEKFIARFRMVTCPGSAAGKSIRMGAGRKTKTDGTPIYDIKNPYLAKVVVNRELHSSLSDRSCRHMELEIGQNLTFQPGDHLGVYPENDITLVNQLAERLNLDLNMAVALVPIENKTDDTAEAVLGPCTLRQAFTDAIDITTPPRKAVLRALAEFASDPEEKKKLIHLSSDEATEEYNKLIKTDYRNIIEVLHLFPSCNPPLPIILELLPRQIPRYYSISSSPSAHPGYVHITLVVVNFRTNTGRLHNGVCSSWLAKLAPGALVPVFTRESHFHLPPTPVPLVMVGPGTGLAPFRGFLQEIAHRKSKLGEGWVSALFFGCRNRKHDYIYEEELTHYAQSGTISHFHLAFSRETDSKVYVQNRMLESKQVLWDLLKEKRGYFYVCGDARFMAKAVQQSLLSVVMECGGMNEAQASAYIEELQQSGRYLQDVWF